MCFDVLIFQRDPANFLDDSCPAYLPTTTFAQWQHRHHMLPMCLVSGEKFPLCKEALNWYLIPPDIAKSKFWM